MNHLRVPVNLLKVYTDGSLRRSRGGIGIYSDVLKYSARVRENKDINRIELGAIFASISMKDPVEDLMIFTDSQTSLNALAAYKRTKYDKLAKFILEYVSERQGSVFVTKVKAHSGNVGNEAADSLAKLGTSSDTEFVFPDEFSNLDEWRSFASKQN